MTDFYRGDIVIYMSAGETGRVVEINNNTSPRFIRVCWEYGGKSAWVSSRNFRVVKRGQEFINSLREGETVIVRGKFQGEVMRVVNDQVKIVDRKNYIECWYSATDIERPEVPSVPVLPNTIGSQVIVHKYLWTLLPKYLTWLNGMFVPEVGDEDLIWILTTTKAKSMEYLSSKDVSQFTWTLIRDAGKS